MNIPYLNHKNYPKVPGVYFAGNMNTTNNRIEVEKVVYNGEGVIVDNIDGYIPEDWSFWSDLVTE